MITWWIRTVGVEQNNGQNKEEEKRKKRKWQKMDGKWHEWDGKWHEMVWEIRPKKQEGLHAVWFGVRGRSWLRSRGVRKKENQIKSPQNEGAVRHRMDRERFF